MNKYKINIIFIRRNDFNSMLDHATWIKTVDNLNKHMLVSAKAIFYTTNTIKNENKNIILIRTTPKRILKYFDFLFKLLSVILSCIDKNAYNFIIFDVMTYYLYPILKIFNSNMIKGIIDYRTFYFNFDKKGKIVKDTLYKANTLISFHFAKLFSMKYSFIVPQMINYLNRRLLFGTIRNNDYLIWSSGIEPNDFEVSEILSNQLSNYAGPKFIFHGHFTSNRGLLEYLQVAKLLVEMKFDFRIYFIGDGPIKLTLSEYIKNNNLSKYCKMIGKVPYNEIKNYVFCADVGLLGYPNIEYWNYNNPIKLSEYMYMNKFIISTKIHAFQEMLNHAEGIFIENNDMKNLSKAFIFVITNISEIRKRNINSKDYILSQYTWSAQANKILEFIEFSINEK